MKWIDIAKKQPPFGEKIWVWDNLNYRKFIVVYSTSKEAWERSKHDMTFPLWAYINTENKDTDET